MPVHGGIYEIWLGSSTLLGSTFHLHSYQKSASIFLFVGLAMPYGKPDKESLVLSDFLFFIKKGPLRGPFHHFSKENYLLNLRA